MLVDSAGQIWTLVLAPDPHVSASGSIDLEDGEIVAGIAAPTADFRTLVVGITNTAEELPTFEGRVTAGRFVGFDLALGRISWKASSPTPIESIVAAPNGLVYGYRSDPEFAGGDLVTIDPSNGDIDVIATGLETDPGRLLILPHGFVQHVGLSELSPAEA